MQIKKLLFLFILFISSFTAIAQTISPGDIAIIGYNAKDPDELAFVCLVDIPANTQLNFTDNGWYATGGFRANEGKFTYTFSSFTSAGTIISPSVSGVAFASAGDQVLVYQGLDSSPTFIFGFNNDGAGVWQSDATSPNTSALPSGLINGTTAVAINEIDNSIYVGITSGTQAELLAAICNKSNWLGSDDTRQIMPTGSFTVTGGSGSAPLTPTANSATNITHDSFTANWGASFGASSYYLDVATDVNFNNILTNYNNKNVDNVLSYSTSSLSSNTDYYYRVRASNSYGTSDNSNSVLVTTLDLPTTLVQFQNTSGSIAENGVSFDIAISILYPDVSNATTADLVLISGDAVDIDNFVTQTITFPAGSSTNQKVTINITNDGITEGNEILTFELQNIGGGNSASVGTTSQFSLTIIEGYSGNYYAPITSGAAGDQLHFELHNLIKGHLEYPYSSSGTDVWDILMDADEDPENSDNVILIYTGRSQAKTFNASTNTSDDAWNREHVWAKSRGDFGTDPAAGTDAHHLKASDASVNSTRGNKDFDDGGTQVSDGGTLIDCYTDADSWEPRDEVKGDVARMLFYMDVRYDGERTDPELHLVDYTASATGEPVIGKLSTLLDWNAGDPPDAFEIRRNNVVYGYQFNRNPFIDHPEWVDLIWGTSAPNSPVIANVDRNVKVPDHDQNITVTADISDDGSINKAEIKYSVDNGSLVTIPMSVSGGGSALYKETMAVTSNTYSATIPESVYENGSFLSYYIYTEDNEGNPKYGTIQQLFTGITEIAKLHSVKADGRLDYDGILAKINGIATVGTPTFSSTSLDVYLQDETGGISIYKAGDVSTSIVLGNNYTITGNLDLFNGKTELIPEVSSVDIVDNGAATLPQPFEMTLAQLLTNAEIMEGRLVLIHNLSLISGTWGPGQSVVLSDDGGTTQITLHYDSSTDLGTTVPTWPKDITGIYSQYDQIYPYVDDYQLLPRQISDINNSVSVQLTILLEGNYNSTTGEMLAGLNTILPKTSPYSEDPRTVLSIPQDIVDWVLVELRETLSGPAVSSRSALLHKDGRIVADDGISSTIRLTGDPKQYYIVVKHRNHLPIISTDPVTLNTN